MKYFLIIIVVALTSLGSYRLGLNEQCTIINLNNDYSFTCDGRKIQGPTYNKEYVTQSWEFHKN